MKTEPITRARAFWDEGQAWRDIMAALRDEGYKKIDCIRVTVDLLRLPLSDAKPLVHLSDVWRDTRAVDDAFHALTLTAAEDLNDPDRLETQDSDLSERELAERLVGLVTALRTGDMKSARAIVAELLDTEDENRVVLLSGVLTAALAEMAEVGHENLVEALGILVASGVDAPGVDTADAMTRAEEALAADG